MPLLIMLYIQVDWTKIACTDKVLTMTELNMYSTWSYVQNLHRQNFKWRYIVCPLPLFCFAETYIVYGQGPKVCVFKIFIWGDRFSDIRSEI